MSPCARGARYHPVVGHPHHGRRKRTSRPRPARREVAATITSHPSTTPCDEQRYFEPGSVPGVFQVGETRFGLTSAKTLGPLGPLPAPGQQQTCRWHPKYLRRRWGPSAEAGGGCAQCCWWLNASPNHMGKQASPVRFMRGRVTENRHGARHANLVGGRRSWCSTRFVRAPNLRGALACELRVEEALGW